MARRITQNTPTIYSTGAPVESIQLEFRGNTEEQNPNNKGLVQWTTQNNVEYIPCGQTTQVLEPGYYEILHGDYYYFQKIPVKTEGLLEFPDASTTKVVAEIKKFWDLEDKFKFYNLTHKRGIILYGPPGGGKTCTLQLVCRDVIKRGGIVIKFTNPHVFTTGMRKFREIQPDTPVVVLMEDIDSTIRSHSETDVINILDGVEKMNKIVFLATTNYPEQLGERILNRPSRFDKRYKVSAPGADSRKIYFEYLLSNAEEGLELDMTQWVKDTDGFSIAHLKELFVAVYLLGDTYEDALKTLKSMKNEINSWESESKKNLGFKVDWE